MNLNLLKTGESCLGFVKSFNMPLGFARAACGLGSAFSYTSELSHKALKRVNLAAGPSDFASLALDTINLIRSLQAPRVEAAKVSELALSVLKKSCDIFRWLQRYSLVTIESSILRRLEGISILSDLTLSSSRLWQELGPTPPDDKDLIISIPKILKFSLLLYAYISNNKRVKFVATGIGLIGDSYSLYKHCRSFSFQPRTWNITSTQVCQIISSIAIASLAYIVLENEFFTDTTH